MGSIFRGSLKNRTVGTKDNPLTAYEKQKIKFDKKEKQTTKDAVFNVKAGQFDKGTLSGIAKELGVTLKSLEKDNPKITDLNKIKDGQIIKVPVRKKTFFENYIAGSKNSPTVVKGIRTTNKKRQEVVYKKGSQGPVYKGMSVADMKKLQLKKNKTPIKKKAK